MRFSNIYSFVFCIVILISISIFSCKPSLSKGNHFPAEWAPHESIWLAWPVFETRKGLPSWPVHISIMKELSKRKIYTDLLVNSEEEKAFVLSQLAKNNIDSAWIRFHLLPHQDMWMRDMGPIFVVDSTGKKKLLTISLMIGDILKSLKTIQLIPKLQVF